MELITVINCRLFVTNEYQWCSLSSFMTDWACAWSSTGQAAARPSVEIFLSRLRVDAEEENVRVEFVLQLPGSLAVQLAEVVRHHSGGQTEHQARFYNKKYPETGPIEKLSLFRLLYDRRKKDSKSIF